MPSPYTAVFAKHATLVANTVDTVTFSGTGKTKLQVINRSGSAAIHFVRGNVDNVPADPAVAGDDTLVLPAAVCVVELPALLGKNVVKLISTGTPDYSVQVVN